VFFSLKNTTGAKIRQIPLTLRHCTPRALCRSIETNTDSLVKMNDIVCSRGGGRGGRGGGKRSWSKALPPVSPWSACFLLLFARETAKDFFLIFSRAQKYWREKRPLDPLAWRRRGGGGSGSGGSTTVRRRRQLGGGFLTRMMNVTK